MACWLGKVLLLASLTVVKSASLRSLDKRDLDNATVPESAIYKGAQDTNSSFKLPEDSQGARNILKNCTVLVSDEKNSKIQLECPLEASMILKNCTVLVSDEKNSKIQLECPLEASMELIGSSDMEADILKHKENEANGTFGQIAIGHLFCCELKKCECYK